ncbi:M15 family metallopeptidase [Nocardioides conyzicola]|uniref:D-alanyl-D-alanine carboxypeptidase-like core domain-containing protein n=1 Tax=Nocardioides conyzicola TaxID=1651781 RepID=A0ABP8WJN8_9ACTN
MAISIILLATACTSAGGHHAARPETPVQSPAAMTVKDDAAPPPKPFDRTAHSTVDPASIWVVVNKKHPIVPDYHPDITLVRGYQVATPAAGPLAELLDDSDGRGLGFKIASAYRSYGYQAGVYGNIVAASGQAAADRVSARPGHSEHQTGLAVDLVTPASPGCDFEACFAGTPGGRWLARNAWRYGFVVRYQPGNEAVTGYSPEPWHLRFVGRQLAAELRRTHADTLEEFFDISGGDYP